MLLHKSRYLCYYRDLRNGTIITEAVIISKTFPNSIVQMVIHKSYFGEVKALNEVACHIPGRSTIQTHCNIMPGHPMFVRSVKMI